MNAIPTIDTGAAISITDSGFSLAAATVGSAKAISWIAMA